MLERLLSRVDLRFELETLSELCLNMCDYFKHTSTQKTCKPAVLQKGMCLVDRLDTTFEHSIQIILIIASKYLIYLCGSLYG